MPLLVSQLVKRWQQIGDDVQQRFLVRQRSGDILPNSQCPLPFSYKKFPIKVTGYFSSLHRPAAFTRSIKEARHYFMSIFWTDNLCPCKPQNCADCRSCTSSMQKKKTNWDPEITPLMFVDMSQLSLCSSRADDSETGLPLTDCLFWASEHLNNSFYTPTPATTSMCCNSIFQHTKSNLHFHKKKKKKKKTTCKWEQEHSAGEVELNTPWGNSKCCKAEFWCEQDCYLILSQWENGLGSSLHPNVSFQ